jgi:hypothetical protein
MASLTRWSGVLAGMILLALAGCETIPPPPLMSSIASTGVYGYSEVQLGEARYDVSYQGQSRRTLRSPESLAATAAAERTQAHDFALWRAAQLALAQGYAGFSASNVRSNVNTVVEDYDPLYGPWYGPGFYRYPYWNYPYGPYWAPSPYAFEQTSVTIEIQLRHAVSGGDYNAADVIAQLRSTYPGAEGPPIPAPTS